MMTREKWRMYFILELGPYENWRKKWRKSAFAHTLYFSSDLLDENLNPGNTKIYWMGTSGVAISIKKRCIE